jgi:hypothetical protein
VGITLCGCLLPKAQLHRGSYTPASVRPITSHASFTLKLYVSATNIPRPQKLPSR